MFHVKPRRTELKIAQIDTRRIIIFLLFAFGIAWTVGLIVYLRGGLVDSPALIPGTGITEAVVFIALGYMWAPALAHILTRLITKEGWKDAGVRPNLRERWPAWVLAWFLPTLLVFLGIFIYFAIYPELFDTSLGVLSELIGSAEAQSGQTFPLSPWTILLIQVGQAVLLAPLLNGFFTFGEECGWRAYLQPKLSGLGFRKAVVLVGLIWGLWHAPVIAMGHNFGSDYPGAPWTGMLAMTWFTLWASVIFGWLTVKGSSVWPAVIAHASINGIAGTAILLLKPEAQANPLLGPLAVGVIGGLPWLLLGLYLLWKGTPEPVGSVSRETSSKSESLQTFH